MINDAELIYQAGIKSVRPEVLLRSKLAFDGRDLVVDSRKFTLQEGGKIYVIGAGKAAAAMAKATEEILGANIYRGTVIVKYGHALTLDRITVLEAGHPVPDQHGLAATKELIQCISSVNEKDIVIFLLSGGASSLLIDLPEGASLSDITELFTGLLKCGASIHEFNTVRKHLSVIKGGGLLKYTYPATTISLVISDVPGDDLSMVGSGPTIVTSSTAEEARLILERYGLWDRMAPALKQTIQTRLTAPVDENLLFREKSPGSAHAFLIASNKLALTAAAAKAVDLGYHVTVYPEVLEGEAKQVAAWIIGFAAARKKQAKTCFLFGSETTVQVKGNGKGGRCQEMVLSAFQQLKETPGEFVFLAAGTDGQDGPTEVAGAVIDTHGVREALQLNINEQAYLANNDAYHFFKKTGGHIKTGPTYTNVMDMVIVLTS